MEKQICCHSGSASRFIFISHYPELIHSASSCLNPWVQWNIFINYLTNNMTRWCKRPSTHKKWRICKYKPWCFLKILLQGLLPCVDILLKCKDLPILHFIWELKLLDIWKWNRFRPAFLPKRLWNHFGSASQKETVLF